MQTRSAAVALSVRSRHPHWIVGRGLCLYRHENFGHVAANRRAAALRLQLPVWSPFANTGHHCVWAGSDAMVWLWDADAVQPQAADAQPRAADVQPDGAAREVDAVALPSFEVRHATVARVRPETVFHPRRQDGACLLPCQEGAELQFWRGAVLTDSFWSPVAPDASRQAWFLQRNGVDATALVAAPPPAPIAAEPWVSPVRPAEWLAARERPLAVAALALLLAAALWFEARHWKVTAAADAVTAEFAARQDELGPVLAARDELLQLRRRGEAMRAILATPSQARIMGLVDAALPSPVARFRRWRYQQGELRVLVADSQLDPLAYVQALEPHFAGVEVGASRQGRGSDEENVEIILRMAAP